MVSCGQETTGPIDRSSARTARAALQNDEAWQVLRFAADSVRHPRTDTRASEQSAAGIHEELGRRMIEKVRCARLEERDVVHNRRHVRKQF